MKVIAVTNCDDHLYHGGYKAINSFKYFHPDIPIFRYGTKEIGEIKEKYNCDNFFYLGCIIARDIWYKEKPDLLIKLAGDCLCLGKLDILFDLDFDFAAARNDCDVIGNRDERINRPDEIIGILNDQWVNADFFLVKNQNFLDDWMKLCFDYHNKNKICINRPNKYWEGDDQCAMNIIFQDPKYKSVILDPVGSKVCFGASANWNGYQDGTNWPAWKDIVYDEVNNYCVLKDGGIGYDRIVKNLHAGGGTSNEKLSWNLFNPEFQKYLTKITDFNQ